jgi:hypothetical protein
LSGIGSRCAAMSRCSLWTARTGGSAWVRGLAALLLLLLLLLLLCVY